MKKITYIILSLLLSSIALQFVISACSQEVDCSETSRKMMYANIYKMSSNVAVRDTLDSLTVTAVGTDSIIINKEAKVTSVELPLCWTKDTTKLIFHYANTKTVDTLTVIHSNTPTFISMDCGYSVEQQISSVKYTKHVLDSVYVSYNKANVDAIQNLELFY